MEIVDEINGLIKNELVENGISPKDVSDVHHTFRQLYQQRMVLFCVICKMFPELSWKSRKHFDEENDPMFNGCFVVGINTPLGVATYHFKLENWDMFDVAEIDRAPKYDFYTPEDVLDRVMSLTTMEKPYQKIKTDHETKK